MSIGSAPYYYVRCDNCGRPADYGDFTAWPTPDQALHQLGAYWTTNGQRHHCPTCPQLANGQYQEVPD